ncbi:MAG: coiled-coil domain-containing protein [Cellvibrionaceae bacterium]
MSPVSVYAQDEGENADEPFTIELGLSQLKQALSEKEKEKRSLERQFKSEQDELIKDQLQQELTSANEVIVGLREEIVALSTGGARLYDEPPVVQREFDWRKDLELIFEPLLDQLRQISERPRVIEKLESDIAFWQDRKVELSAAIANLKANIDEVSSSALKKDLRALLNTATSRANTAEQKLSLLSNELAVLERQKNPIWSTLGDIFSTIILSILFHFFIAVVVAFLVYQAIRLLTLLPIYIIAKNNPGEAVTAEHAVVIFRVVIGSLLAVMTYFIVLYSFAEWLLLVVSFLLIMGLALALRNTLPQYFVEIKTVLNMGSIRQGERITFNGLPWRVTRLNVNTRLHNPALHGHLRVPLAELIASSSRPYHKDEPWFPTKVGDVVFLEDEVFGKVVRQTPDIVELNLGGSIYSYQTSDFLSKRPRNLSREGFTIYEIFGFDYQHQKTITHEILDIYKSAIVKAISESDFAEYNNYISVDFESASASSLDFKIFASFSGEAAESYFKIKRLLQKASVEVANEHAWVIPFQQLTVHHQPVE